VYYAAEYDLRLNISPKEPPASMLKPGVGCICSQHFFL
jgi:hypothetical protein